MKEQGPLCYDAKMYNMKESKGIQIVYCNNGPSVPPIHFITISTTTQYKNDTATSSKCSSRVSTVLVE